jgi:hypothetical protein
MLLLVLGLRLRLLLAVLGLRLRLLEVLLLLLLRLSCLCRLPFVLLSLPPCAS